jgi:hypothetical protein
MAKGLLLHEQKVVDLRHADMKPWPPPTVLSSDLVEMEIVREGAKLSQHHGPLSVQDTIWWQVLPLTISTF